MTNSEQAFLRLGTRGSQLALYQATTVAALLRAEAGVECEITIIKTAGDRLADAKLSEIGGKGLFVKEIEDALLGGDIDLAVHSSKDMPAVLPRGLEIGAVLPREDARDAVVLPLNENRNGVGSRLPTPLQVSLSVEELVARLGRAPRIGTSSVRRSAQLIRLFPGAAFQPIRGNLDTRLRKVDSGDFDAIVLAAAGLRRLEQAHRISASLPVTACVPAPGQGIIAIEIRSDDERMRARLQAVDDPAARAALDAERAVVTRLGGGCQMPIGAYASITGAVIDMTALVVSLDGSRAIRAEGRGPLESALAVGTTVADELLAQGAGDILAHVERASGSVEGLQP